MRTTRALVRGGAEGGLSSLLDLAAALVSAALVARFLGPSGLGRLSLLLALFLAANAVVDLGASALLTREVARAPGEARARLREHLKLKLLLLGVLSPVILAIFGLMSLTGARVAFGAADLAAGLPFLVCSSLNITLAAALRGLGLLSPLAIASAPAFLVQALGCWLVLGSARGLASVLLVMGGAQALKLILIALIFNLKVKALPKAPGGRVAEVFRAALPFAGVAALGTAYLKADIFLLSALAGPVETGFYAAAVRVVETLKLLPGAFLAVLYPELVRRESGSSFGAGRHPHPDTRGDRYEDTAAGLYRGFAYPALAGALGLLVAAPWIVFLLYGAGLGRASLALRILALALLPAIFNSASVLHLYARSEEGAVMRRLATALVANVVLNLLLVPVAGSAGSAMALVGSEWMLFSLYRRALGKRSAPAEGRGRQSIAPGIPAPLKVPARPGEPG